MVGRERRKCTRGKSALKRQEALLATVSRSTMLSTWVNSENWTSNCQITFPGPELLGMLGTNQSLQYKTRAFCEQTWICSSSCGQHLISAGSSQGEVCWKSSSCFGTVSFAVKNLTFLLCAVTSGLFYLKMIIALRSGQQNANKARLSKCLCALWASWVLLNVPFIVVEAVIFIKIRDSVALQYFQWDAFDIDLKQTAIFPEVDNISFSSKLQQSV